VITSNSSILAAIIPSGAIRIAMLPAAIRATNASASKPSNVFGLRMASVLTALRLPRVQAVKIILRSGILFSFFYEGFCVGMVTDYYIVGKILC
jgi:hypothetical protein